MKTFFLSLCLLRARHLLILMLIGGPSHFCLAQITIGQSDMPSAGDTLRVSYTLDTLDPTLTGANYTWNYANLNPTSQWLENFDAPGTFIFPFNLLFNVANTSYGREQYTPDSIPGTGLNMDNAYGFFKKSTTDLKQIGYGLNINSLPIPFSYSLADFIYRFPLDYGDKDSCDAMFGPSIPIGYYYGQNIHRVNEVDGWGTLTTPYGTFQTLRVKSMITTRDTFADTTGAGFAFTRPLQYEYKWLKQGGKIPYLQINATEVAGNQVVTQISYRDSMRSGTVQIGINESAHADFGMQLFPNPALDYAFVQYTIDNSVNVKIELLDINGKKISTLRSAKQTPGPHIEIINLRELNLQSGTYFVCVYAGIGKAVKKIILKGQ